MLGAIMQSRGAEDRSSAELNLLKNENSKRVRIESTVQSGRVAEKNALSSQADESKKKTIDAWYQLKSADSAASAAKNGMIAAVVGMFTAMFSQSSSSNALDTAMTALSQIMTVAGAYLAYLGAKDEAEMLGKQFGHISKDAKEDNDAVNALDGANPVA